MDCWGPSAIAKKTPTRKPREHTFHATEGTKSPILCTDTPSSSSSSSSIHIPMSAHVKDWRRRSVDVGGLHLATENIGQGHGWMGGHPGEIEYVMNPLKKKKNSFLYQVLSFRTMFAEMLSDLYTETLNSVNGNSLEMYVVLHLFFIVYAAQLLTRTIIPVSQQIFLNLYDHVSYILWIVGISNPIDYPTNKFSLVLYYYLKPSSESKECERLFHSRCVSVFFSISTETDGRLTLCYHRYRTSFSFHPSPSPHL